jgi:serine/threonine protein kinase/tetratricopeptide (TPR) repeat protein
MIGSVVSHYRVEEHLGGGGMGVVYRGLDLHLDRSVALKFLPAHLSSSFQAETRFVQEAKAASALDHSHIVTIFDIDRTEDGQLFIVMGYCPGETLKKKIEQGPVPVTQAVLWTIEVAEALEQAHKHGIVHRDIKPSNILISQDEKSKLVDFGLARLVEDTTLTDPGAVIGTTLYMSPEQIRGERVDHQTDIWSLGVVLYEMVTGKLPFSGPTAASVMHAIIEARTPRLADSVVDGGPEGLQRILDKAMAKDPQGRYQDIAAMLTDLRQLFARLSTATVPAPPPTPPPRWGGAKWIAAAVAVGATILVPWLLLDNGDRPLDIDHVGAPRIETTEAQRYFDQALDYERRGDLRVALGNAEALYRKALALAPENGHVQAHLASLLVRTELSFPGSEGSDEAEALIRSALAQSPEQACAWVAKGYLALLRGDGAGAEQAARRALALNPEQTRAHVLLGEAQAAMGQQEAALATVKAAIDLEDGYLWAHPVYARLLLSLGRDEEAIEEYQEVLQLWPDSVGALNNLGAIYIRHERYPEAEEALRRALQTEPDPVVAMNLGTVLFYQGRMQESIEAYLQAHDLNPEDPLIQANLGEAYEEIGELASSRLWYDKALTTYDAQFQRHAASAEELSDRAFYAAKAGRTDEAIQGIVAAVTATQRDQVQPDSLVLFQAAKIYALAGRRSETLSYAKQAIAAGYPRAQFQAEPSFRAFLNDSDFRALLETESSP